MEDIRRKCNPMMNLSKFISNKKILIEVVVIQSLGCLGARGSIYASSPPHFQDYKRDYCKFSVLTGPLSQVNFHLPCVMLNFHFLFYFMRKLNFHLENLNILDFVMFIRMIVWLNQFDIDKFFETKLQLLLALNAFKFLFNQYFHFIL